VPRSLAQSLLAAVPPGGLEFVEPGFGPVPLWRPELGATADAPVIGQPAAVPDAPWGGVARKP
jgi:hypothetical protein